MYDAIALHLPPYISSKMIGNVIALSMVRKASSSSSAPRSLIRKICISEMDLVALKINCLGRELVLPNDLIDLINKKLPQFCPGIRVLVDILSSVAPCRM